MENIAEEVLQWLMKTTEVLATAGYMAAKQYIIASALVWLIAGIVVIVSSLIAIKWALKTEKEVWGLDKGNAGTGYIFTTMYIAVIITVFLALVIPNTVKLLSPDWYTIDLLIHTISGK